MTKQANVVIRGKSYDLKAFNGLQKSAATANETIGIMANYAAAQAVFHDNFDALQNLIKGSPFALSSGQLSATGKKVVEYIKAHAGQYLKFDQKEGRWASEFKGKDRAEKRAAARGFINPENPDAGLICKRDETGQNPEDMSFSLTFDQFLSLVKEGKKEDKPEGVKVSTIVGQLKKAKEAPALLGSAEELGAALAELEAVKAAMVAALGAQLKAEADKAKRLAELAGLAQAV